MVWNLHRLHMGAFDRIYLCFWLCILFSRQQVCLSGLLFFLFFTLEYKVQLFKNKIKEIELLYCSECIGIVVSKGVSSLCIELNRSLEGGLRKECILSVYT